MILFNITMKIDHDVHNDFLQWIRGEHTGDRLEGTVMASRLYRLTGVDVRDGITYCLQHYFRDNEAYNQHVISGDLAFREDLSGRYGDKLVVFSSVLAEV